MPVFPDTRDYTIVDSPIVVEEDRVELWLQVTAREHDFADDEWSYGQIRLFVPNAPERKAMSDKQSIDAPNERRPFQAHGHMDVVTLGDFTLGRGVFEPGWRWSNDVKPIAGTDSCQTHHTGICVSGRMTVRFDDGTEMSITPGDVVDIDPGHDAWTDGDEPCLLFDTGVKAYAKPS